MSGIQTGSKQTGQAWLVKARRAGLEVRAAETYDADDRYSTYRDFWISATPEKSGVATPKGFYDDWYTSDIRTQLMDLLLEIPGVEMERREDEAARVDEDKVWMWTDGGSGIFRWQRNRVEEGFYWEVKQILEVEERPIKNRAELNDIFDQKVRDEIALDPKVKAIRERQAALAAEEAQLVDEMAQGLEPEREAFVYVADGETFERDGL